MTLIASYITKFGIIQTSDSNLSSNIGNSGFGQKIFPIPRLNSSMAYSGSYSIDGKEVDEWINNFIYNAEFTAESLKELAEQLSLRLTMEMREYEISEITIVHIAGYTKYKDENYSFAEHWHIANTTVNNEDGSYNKAQDKFHYHNDFNSRKPEHRKIIREFDGKNSYKHKWYINGFPPGRISLVSIKKSIDKNLKTIWDHPGWKFKRPTNIFEFSNIVKLYFDFVIRLFPISDYNTMFIGGEIQSHLIPVPEDLQKAK